MIHPPSSTKMTCACVMVESRCAMMRVVLPLHISSNAPWISYSVCESSALVASSSRTILGFLRIVRAMATRCFSPPESFNPRSPTLVSYLSGKFMIVSCTAAILAASMISSRLASCLPYAKLYLMVSLKRTASCGTIPIASRSDCCFTFRMSMPSTHTAP
mmetsp:Transcript_12598/g.28953  ORF Transcript_12598/g.28953 Transcript_12598/m.28953 type:complete len:160 (+) Transcript_12598:3521-4000(+)